MAKQIQSILTQLIPDEHRWKINLLKEWDSIIGPLKGKVIVDKIQGEVLVLGVVHPAWAQELHMLMPLLKKKINACLDKERITVIRFRFIDKAVLCNCSAIFRPKIRKSIIPPAKHDTLNHAETSALLATKDMELRAALESFLHTSRQQKIIRE